jgi:CheY-like chemotaxis protein
VPPGWAGLASTKSKTVAIMHTNINPIRILVVDDSPDECAVLKAELRAVQSVKLIGFVQDGIEAIHYLRGIEKFKNRELFPYPELLLLDYNMPRCNGLGVLGFLQRQFHRPRVVLWSNTLDPINVPLALRLGADLVCRKPSTKQELMDIIHRLEARVFRISTFHPADKKFETFCDPK